jgi:WD40 repeat protein
MRTTVVPMSGPPAIPDHTLLRPIGRGAYGEVWLAQNVMGNFRAVKVIWRRRFDSDRPFEREFAGIRRFEPISRSTGGLVHVLHVGRNDAEGYFYYVMELADATNARAATQNEDPKDNSTSSSSSEAQPLMVEAYKPRTLRSELARQGKLSTEDCIRVGLDVVGGLAQLHAHGLIHRDIKPGNIIFVHGRAKLADLGLVSVPGEGRTFVGTEGYIAPEGPGTPAADLYALGVVLFEASTGFPPERLPDAPNEWFARSASDAALEFHEVILRACEGRRERRYQNANGLQADLALLQSGQSIRHMRALERRYALLRGVGVMAGIMLVCAVIVVLLANYRARVASESRARETVLRQQAQKSLSLARAAESEARNQLNAALYEEARALVLSKELGHRTRALEAIRRVSGATNIAELRRVAFAALQLADLRLDHEVTLPQNLTLSQLDPRFERIALGNGASAISIHSLPGLEVLQTLPATSTNPVFEARWSHDGRFLAVKRQLDGSGKRSNLEVWRLDPSAQLLRIETNVAYHSFSLNPCRAALVTGHIDGKVQFFDLETNAPERKCEFGQAIHAVEYSPDGKRFGVCYSTGTDWQIAICEVATGALLNHFECPNAIEQIAWHPHGKSLSTAGFDTVDWNREVHLLSLENGTTGFLGRHKVKTVMVGFSPDGGYLMSGGWDKQLFCWDLRSHQRVFTFAGSGNLQWWRADTSQFAMILPSLQLKVFNFDRPACLELSGNVGEGLRPGTFSPDGRWFAAPDAKNIWLWELGHNSEPVAMPVQGPVQLFFSPDSSIVFAVGGPIEAAHLQAWKVEFCSQNAGSPQLTPLQVKVPYGLSHAALAADNLILTSAEGVRSVNLTNLAAGIGDLKRIPSGNGIVSPDGQWLAVNYSYSSRVTVYRLPDVQRVAQLETRNLVGDVCFSPAGDELAVINRSGVELWDTQTWHLKRLEPEHPVANSYLLYASDGKGFWKVTNFRDAALHDRQTFKKILPLPANVLPIALGRDGRMAVSVDDQRVQIWDLASLRAELRESGLDWE